MKKKLTSILLAIMCVFALGFCALACGDSQLDGTWYMWTGDQQITAAAYEFDGGDIEVAGVELGEYTIDGKNVTITVKGAGTLKGKIVSDGVIKIDGAGNMYFCKKGKTPPTETAED